MTEPTMPRHTPVSTRAILDLALKSEWFQVYARLRALAWKHDYKNTDWLDAMETADLLGMSWANVKKITAELKDHKIIDWTNDGKNRRRYFFVEVRLELGAKAQICAPSSSSGINTLISQEDLLLPGKAQIGAMESDVILDKESWQALREAGIGEPARTELSNLPAVTARYIRAMAAQAKRDGVTAGGLIYRIHNDWPAPEWCGQCGELDGEHAGSCPTQAERRVRESSAAERDRNTLAEEKRGQPMSAEMQEAEHVWKQALVELQLQLTGATFDTWLGRTRLISSEDGTFIIGVHNRYAQDWLENRLASMVQRTLTGIVGKSTSVRFVVYGAQNELSSISQSE